jgi:hypothetical protein
MLGEKDNKPIKARIYLVIIDPLTQGMMMAQGGLRG